jgi:hypothetical protein
MPSPRSVLQRRSSISAFIGPTSASVTRVGKQCIICLSVQLAVRLTIKASTTYAAIMFKHRAHASSKHNNLMPDCVIAIDVHA